MEPVEDEPNPTILSHNVGFAVMVLPKEISDNGMRIKWYIFPLRSAFFVLFFYAYLFQKGEKEIDAQEKK